MDSRLLTSSLANKLDLALALLVGQAAVDQGDLAGKAEAFEPAHQKLRGVAVLGEPLAISYSFTAPAVSPCVKNRWVKRKNSTVGTKAMMEAAEM